MFFIQDGFIRVLANSLDGFRDAVGFLENVPNVLIGDALREKTSDCSRVHFYLEIN